MKFEFNIDGQTQVERLIRDYGSKFKSFKVVLNQIADDFYDTEKQVFGAEGAWENREKWKDLTPDYFKAKQRLFPGTKTLEKSGALKKSLTLRSDPNAEVKIQDLSIEIDSKVKTPDGKYKLVTLHNRGWEKPEIRPKNAKILRFEGPDGAVFAMKTRAVKVPARPPATISEAQKARWMKFFHVYMEKSFNEVNKGGK